MDYTVGGKPPSPPCRLCQAMASIYQATRVTAVRIAGVFKASRLDDTCRKAMAAVRSLRGSGADEERKPYAPEEAERRFRCLVWIAVLLLSLLAWTGIIATTVWLVPD